VASFPSLLLDYGIQDELRVGRRLLLTPLVGGEELWNYPASLFNGAGMYLDQGISGFDIVPHFGQEYQPNRMVNRFSLVPAPGAKIDRCHAYTLSLDSRDISSLGGGHYLSHGRRG
jgi:hypothetical protein